MMGKGGQVFWRACANTNRVEQGWKGYFLRALAHANGIDKKVAGFRLKKGGKVFLRALADVIKSCPKKVERLFCEHALMQIVSKKGGKLFLRALADYKSCRKKWQKVFVRKGGKVFLRALQIV